MSLKECLLCILLSKNCECTLSYLKMTENIINMIVLQDELPILLAVEITHETQIKGHHIYSLYKKLVYKKLGLWWLKN